MVKFMIYVFYCDISPLSDDIFFNLAKKCIQKDMMVKTDRLKFRKDKNLSMAGHLLLKYALEYLKFEYENTCFKRTKSGKPFAENINIKFSISHSGNFAAVALSDSDIGIDIEKTKDYNPAVAKRFFTENEYDMIMSFENEHEKEDMFFRMWTLKEAYVKMAGESIFNFKDFEILPFEKKYYCSNTIDGCKFKEFDINGYKMSVSFMTEDAKTEINRISLSDYI